MLNSLKSPLLLSAMLSATLGLTACSSPSSESTDSTATDNSAATDTAADKLDTKFLTIATGGASGLITSSALPYQKSMSKPLGSTQKRKPLALQSKTSTY